MIDAGQGLVEIDAGAGDDRITWEIEGLRGGSSDKPLVNGNTGTDISPSVSASPSIRLAFCKAWPLDPLVRLSSAATTMARPSIRSPVTPIWQKFEPRT